MMKRQSRVLAAAAAAAFLMSGALVTPSEAADQPPSGSLPSDGSPTDSSPAHSANSETTTLPGPTAQTTTAQSGPAGGLIQSNATTTEPVPAPVLRAEKVTPIADIQGDTGTSPLVGKTVTTEGVVTASYPRGGINGFVIQTAGTGGDIVNKTPGRSDAILVYSLSAAKATAIGDSVTVTGTVSEYKGLTEITPVDNGVVKLPTSLGSVEPTKTTWPKTDAEREALESMLIAPQGDFTVTNTYSTNQYGEVGLASGTTPLRQPTDVAAPGSTEAAAVEADNAARALTLDDGATVNFLSSGNRVLTPPFVSTTTPVRVGAPATFTQPVIVTYRNDTWKIDPTSWYQAGTDTAPATFTNTRTTAPAAIGGDISVASFNVLNYFTTLGDQTSGCVAYTDRDGNGVTVKSGCDPRGAWDAANLRRQQDKIVAAINSLDASVVGLMEIENSAKLGDPTDKAVATLVGALNAAAGSEKWAFVPSSKDLPPLSEQDVITNAIIYQTAKVAPSGDSRSLGTQSADGQAFQNAREPIAQQFSPKTGTGNIWVVVNHFKSKGSAGPLPGDADAGDGQGSSNASRVAQATALNTWVSSITTPKDAVALVGDFNSYTQEDPLQVLYAHGYSDVEQHFGATESSYSYDGLSGSLDHVLLNKAALDRATGADIWNINSGESVALEYSRYNAHGSLFYEPDAYRSSDHDPVKVGLSAGLTHIGLLNINDFHGRIDKQTVNFAGTIEEQRADITANGGSALLLSAGDNIGASLFASSSQKDQPTIDVLNALGLTASAVGNHELDKGFSDLVDRVINKGSNATWDYLGANVYKKGTQTPALDEYSIQTVNGVRIGIIGAITQEAPTLVSPAGIENLDFGDPVDAVNRVAGQLTDGNPANGEADILVAEYHEGATSGTPDGATLDQELAAGGVFAKIVNETSPAVDAIFTGHTHKEYAWDAAIPGTDRTRPVVQTGSYGANIGRVDLTLDDSTREVIAHSARNVPRTTTKPETLVSDFPRVASVKDITDKALAEADKQGSVKVGTLTADITTAFSGGSFEGGTYTGGKRDDRGSESTLGDLVADSLVSSLSDPVRGGATIGVVNPGGLRSELTYAQSTGEDGAPDGVITYKNANDVLPFVNNLWTTTLTGAQFKALLEQQWQLDADGKVPARPYLQLGLSKNVSYTFDDAAAQGSHITSITIDGAPYDPQAKYRIGTFSFLALGGDNFREFTQGADTRDSGLIDRDAWISYIQTHSPLSPSFARRSVAAPALGTVTAGDTLVFTVGASPTQNPQGSRGSLDLTSLGSPANTSVTVSWKGQELGTFPVSDGTARISVKIPKDAGTAPAARGARATLPSGSTLDRRGTTETTGTLRIVASSSGTTVSMPLTVKATQSPTPEPSDSATPTPTSSDGATVSPTPSTGTHTSGGLASTGSADLWTLGVLAVALLSAGAMMVRRRTGSER